MTPEQISLLSLHTNTIDLFGNVDGCNCGWECNYAWPENIIPNRIQWANHIAHEMRDL